MTNRPGGSRFLESAALAVRVAVCCLVIPLAQAQSFEIASIKPSALWKAGGEGSSSRSYIEHAANSLTMRNIDLNEMLQWAYAFQPYQISGRGILRDRRYDVQAKSAEPVSVAQLRVMLQVLLADRFKLA